MKINSLLTLLMLSFAAPLFAQEANMSLIPYRKGNVWGYATPERKIVINPEYDDAAFFYAGHAAVKKGDKYGYINTSGEVVVPFKFALAKQFRYGYFDNPKKGKSDTVLFFGASLTRNGYERCFDAKGVQMNRCPAINENVMPDEKVIETLEQKVYTNVKANGDIYDKIYDDYAAGDFKYYISSKNGKYGVFSSIFEVTIPYEYDLVKKLNTKQGTLLLVEKAGLMGILKGDGSVFLPVENNLVVHVKTPSGKEFLEVMKGGLYQLTDMQLNVLSKGDFETIEYDGDYGFVLNTPTKLKGYYFAETGKQVGAVFGNIKVIPGGNYVLATYPSGRSGYINKNAENFFED